MLISHLMDEKIELGHHQLLVGFLRSGEAGCGNCGDRGSQGFVFRELGADRSLTVIAKPRVHRGQGGTVAISTEIGGRDWIPVEMEDEVSVAQLRESSRQKNRLRGRRRRWRRARLDVPEYAKRSGGDSGLLHELPAIHR